MKDELVVANGTVSDPANIGLGTLLIQMTRFGRPTLSMQKDGWHCGIEMNTNTTGSSFTVRSDFGFKKPIQAVSQCMERITLTLKTLGQV